MSTHRKTAVMVMAGAQTTINNQLKAAMATVTETATMNGTTMMMETKATTVASGSGGGSGSEGTVASLVAVAAAWQECGVGGSGAGA